VKAKTIAVWTAGVVAALILIILIAAILIQRNTFVHRYLLARAVQAAENASGAEISIGNFEIRWMPLRVTLEAVVVQGRKGVAGRPLAKLPKVQVGISWDALVHKRIDLTELVLDHPEINLLVNNASESNLPRRPNSATAPSSSKFNIAIEHAEVRSGELRYNNVARKIDADLADFHADVSHNDGAAQYTGTASYSIGTISLGERAPLRHEAQIDFAATTDGITLQRIHVATQTSQLNAKGTVQNFSQPTVQGDYVILLSATDLRREISGVPLENGEIQLAGSLEYNAALGSGLAALSTSGHVSSTTLRIAISTSTLELRSIAGDYSLDRGNLRVNPLDAEAIGGSLHAEFSAQDLAATPRYQAALSMNSLSLGKAKQVAGAGAVPIVGTAHLDARARWVSSLQSLIAQVDASVAAVIKTTPSARPQAPVPAVPVNATLHARYNAPEGTLAITKSTLTSEKTSIAASGIVSDRSSLSVHVRSSDLHETDLLITALRKAMNSAAQTSNTKAVTSPMAGLNLYGTAAVDAQIQGRIQNPHITGHAEANSLEVRHSRWPHIQADFEASASSVTVKNGFAQTANRGHLNFAAATGLQHWSYAATNPVTVQVQAMQVSVADLEQLTGFSEPISGILSANVSIHGTVENPAGAGSVELRNASVAGEPIRSVATNFEGANKTVSASFNITADAGTISGMGEFDTADRGYRFSIRRSVLNLAKLHYLSSRDNKAGGTLAIEAHGQGTLKAPELEVAVNGNQLTFRNTALGSINAQLQVARQQANFTVTSDVAGGQIELNGKTAVAAPYMTQAGFEIRSLNFGPLLAAYAPSVSKQLQGDTEVSGHVEGPLAHPEELKAAINLSTLKLAYQNFSLASAAPVHLNYADDILTISPTELKGTDTDFKLVGTVPLKGSAPLNVSTTGLIDLKLLGVLGGNTQSSGTLKMDVTARGALKKPEIGGTIELTKASFVSETAPIGIENVNARIAVANNRLTINNFSGQMGGGSFSVSGFATYAPISYFLQVNGKSVRIRYPQGTRAQLDAGLTLTGNTANSVLNGRVTIDQLSFTPNFDLANFVGQFTSSAPSVPSKWEQNTHLDVAVASSNVLALSSSQLSLQGSVSLRVAGTIANPIVLGRTTLTGGSLIFMGNLYEVQSGTVVFANPIRTQPSLNLYVSTMVEDYNITLNFVGTLDRLRTNYTSDPALPPVDIIHLLAFGKTTEEAAATATPAAMGAESVIANGLAGQVSNRIEKLTGISQLQIDPSLGGNNSDPGARLAIQERLTSNILFTFATDLTNTQNEVVQVKYQTRGRLSFSLTRDEYGSYSIQVKTHKSF